jgi:polyphosphate glucokinase
MDVAGAPLGPAVGIDIGGTGIKGAPIDRVAGAMLGERVRLHTPSPATPERVADVVAEVLDKVGVGGPIGLTLPSVIRHGVVETAANIDKAWIGINAVDLFTKATGRPVGVVNDADAAGIAEMKFGAGKDRSGVVLLVTLGTGIGSALFVDGHLVPNTELGHLPMHKGDAEDWAAESVRVLEHLSWKEWAKRLDKYFELLEHLFWPELIIVGGGVSKKSDEFLPRISLITCARP